MDLISRQAAIDAVIKRDANCGIDSAEVLKALPSAQPEPCEDKKELKVWFLRMASYVDSLLECSDEQKETLVNLISKVADYMPWAPDDPDVPEPCEDAVSRRRLLSDLKKLIVAWEKYPVMAEQLKGVETAIGYVEAIPSVTPKRKTGKWIYKRDLKQFFCDQCGCPSLTDDDCYIYGMDLPNFCEDCGADMRGGKGERNEN